MPIFGREGVGLLDYGRWVTYAGADIISHLPVGGLLTLSAVNIGKGLISGLADPKAQTGLVESVMTGTTTALIHTEPSTLLTVVEARNDMPGMPTEGFWIREFEIRAVHPVLGDVCFMYATLGDFPQYVHPYISGPPDIRRFPIDIIVRPDLQVVTSYPLLGYMTAEEIQHLLESDLTDVWNRLHLHEQLYVTYQDLGAVTGYATPNFIEPFHALWLQPLGGGALIGAVLTPDDGATMYDAYAEPE